MAHHALEESETMDATDRDLGRCVPARIRAASTAACKQGIVAESRAVRLWTAPR